MIKKLYETNLPMNFSKGLFEEKMFDLAPEHTDKYADIIFTGTSAVLNAAKSKDHPVAVTFKRIDGTLIAAAIVQYFPNEDPAKPGNWNLVWTFNEADIPEGTVIRDFATDQNIHSYYRAVAGDKYRIRFQNTESLTVVSVYLLEHIKKWLDENASATEEVGVEQDALFQARVAVENGEKVFALEPKGEIKMLIKDDASIEK